MNRLNYHAPTTTTNPRNTYNTETYGSRYKRQYGNMRNAEIRVNTKNAPVAASAKVTQAA